MLAGATGSGTAILFSRTTQFGSPIGLDTPAVMVQPEVRETVYTGGPYRDETFRYLFLAPAVVEPETTYPLVLFLHGAGERGTNPRVIQKHFFPAIGSEENRAKYPCFVIAPQCRPNEWWFGARWVQGVGLVRTEEPSDMLKMALGIVDETIREQPVDPTRLYLTGLSMGGFGSWDLADRQPERWAAVVPICGGGDETTAGRLVNVPIWAVHGDADPIVPVDTSRTMIEVIRAAGGNPKYTELRGVGHDSWTPAYADLGVIPWMFEQRNEGNRG